MSSVSLTVRRLFMGIVWTLASWYSSKLWRHAQAVRCWTILIGQTLSGPAAPPTHTHCTHRQWLRRHIHTLVKWIGVIRLIFLDWFVLFIWYHSFSKFLYVLFLYILIEKTLNFDSLFQNALYTYVTEQVADFFQGIHCKQFKLLFCLLKRS